MTINLLYSLSHNSTKLELWNLVGYLSYVSPSSVSVFWCTWSRRFLNRMTLLMETRLDQLNPRRMLAELKTSDLSHWFVDCALNINIPSPSTITIEFSQRIGYRQMIDARNFVFLHESHITKSIFPNVIWLYSFRTNVWRRCTHKPFSKIELYWFSRVKF